MIGDKIQGRTEKAILNRMQFLGLKIGNLTSRRWTEDEIAILTRKIKKYRKKAKGNLTTLANLIEPHNENRNSASIYHYMHKNNLNPYKK